MALELKRRGGGQKCGGLRFAGKQETSAGGVAASSERGFVFDCASRQLVVSSRGLVLCGCAALTRRL